MNEHKTSGDRHDGEPSTHVSFFCNVASHRRLVAEQVTSDEHCYICSVWVLWWTPYHHDLWGTRSPKTLVVMIIVVFWIVWSRDTCLPPWHLKDVDAEVSVVMKAVCSLFFEHNSSVLVRLVFALCVLVMLLNTTMFPSCWQGVQNNITVLLHCVVLWYTLVTVTFERRLFQCVCVDMRECFPIVQFNRHSSCTRDFCIVRSRDVWIITGTCERLSWIDGDWNKCSSPDVFFFVTVAIFVLYGFCDEHRTTKIWEALFDKWWFGMVEAIHQCFCDGATHRLCHRNNNIWHGAVPWWTHTTPPGFLEDTYFHASLVVMEFSCLRRGASDDHCDTHLLPWHLQDVCSEFLFYMLAF